MRHPRFALVLPAVAVLGLVAACSGDDPAPRRTPSSSPTPEASVSTLTGLPLVDGQTEHPVYAVKIENTAAGAPQLGLAEADLVVEELVEGGLTRLAALYSSTLPTRVGHVRSVRATDADIARPVGARVVASGGAPQTYAVLRRAKVAVDAQDQGAAGFSADRTKQAPYDRLVDLRRLARGAGPLTVDRPYLSFAASVETASVPDAERATSASVRFSGAVTTRWAHRDGAWVRTNGHARSEPRVTNLLVLFAPVGDAGYLDPAGNPVPVTRFRGSGRAVVLTGATEARWTKRRSDSTIALTTEGGRAITLPPGRTWIELAPRDGGSVSTR